MAGVSAELGSVRGCAARAWPVTLLLGVTASGGGTAASVLASSTVGAVSLLGSLLASVLCSMLGAVTDAVAVSVVVAVSGGKG